MCTRPSRSCTGKEEISLRAPVRPRTHAIETRRPGGAERPRGILWLPLPPRPPIRAAALMTAAARLHRRMNVRLSVRSRLAPRFSRPSRRRSGYCCGVIAPDRHTVMADPGPDTLVSF